MNRLKFILLFLFILSNELFSQDVEATINHDTNNVMIGEHIKLRIEVKFNNSKNIIFPKFTDTLGKLDIIEKSKIDTIRNDKGATAYGKTLTVTSFDEGSFEVEPLVFSYENPNDSNIRVTSTNSITLNFSTIPIDTSSAELKDIKPPYEIPIGIEDVLPYFGLILLIFLIYYFTIKVLGKKRNKAEKVIPKYDPRIPADLEALEQLQKLERENIWQKGDFKTYHSRLTDILRVYIHRRYHLNALEMTSGELIDELNRYEANPNAMKIIGDILNIADLAKFAKYEPNSNQNADSLKFAINFINLTKVVDISDDENIREFKGVNQ